ncbi:ATP-binding cassette domain-containing protein [Alteromonas sp. H39]|uniref:ATP-binding cassette domain-containing protein n=1 Tax=Alteromonas sp. H39 TaxID=3389876 RepID=UPI0039E108F9
MTVELHSVSLDKRLNDVTCHCLKGQSIHLLGENGAGKSSLLEVIAGLTEADNGHCRIEGTPVNALTLPELARFRAFHAQFSSASFALSVKEYLQFYSSSPVPPLPAILEFTMEVSHLLTRRITTLSGGEKQRVDLCRALLQVWPAIETGDALILLDEPLQGLDIKHQYALMALTRELTSKGNTVILTSHDIGLSANNADQIWLLKHGALVANGEPLNVVNEINLNATFGCHFAVKKLENFLQIQVCDPIVMP